MCDVRRMQGTPVVRVDPALATSGPPLGCYILIWTQWSQISKISVILKARKQYGTLKRFIRKLHDNLRYTCGMKAPCHYCAPKQKGFVRKRLLSVIYARSFDVLYIWSVHFCVCPSDVFPRVLYFNNVKKQSLSAIRQGRLEMSRGKVPRNVHYLAIILQIFKMICNVAMHTRCARYCNAAKMFGNSTRQRTYVFYLCTEQNQSTSVMRQGVLGMLCGNSTPSLYIYIYSLC